MSHSEEETSMAISTAQHVQTDTRLLANNLKHCWMWPVAPICTPVACCCVFLGGVAQSLKQLPTFLLFHDNCQSVAQHCWICLLTPFNIVGARHPRYSWFCGLYPSHDALQVTTLLAVVHPFAPHCQHIHNNFLWCEKLLHPFARILKRLDFNPFLRSNLVPS